MLSPNFFESIKMTNKKIASLLCFFVFQSYLQAQVIRTTKKDTTYWTQVNRINFDFNQIAFSNWNAGGNTSISGIVRTTFQRRYQRGNFLWNNELLTRYGINKQEGRELRKTDDQLIVNSNFGYKKAPESNWFYSGRFNLTTQFANGYAYPNTEVAISAPFAPAFIFLGVGSEYNMKPKEFNIYMSPLTIKNTLVLNQRLANQGAFGVTKAIRDEEGEIIRKGRMSRTEMGILINQYWRKEVVKNIILENRVILFTDYLNSFGNIDIDWQLQLDMIVNQYVRANIGFHIIYDDDTKATRNIEGQQVTIGPRIQLRQALGVGVAYEF